MNTSSRERNVQALRDELLEEQLRLRRDPTFALAVIIAGAPAAGRSEVLNELMEWLDPKFISVHAFHEPDREDRQRPALYRYWRTAPARGRMAFYLAAWYGDVFASPHRVNSRRTEARAIERIRQLEAMLAADRVRVVKLYLTIDASTQRERLDSLRADKLTRWRVTDEDLWLAKHYARAARTAARAIKATDEAHARWRVIAGADEEQRLIDAARCIRDALRDAFGVESASRGRRPRARGGSEALKVLARRTDKSDEKAPILAAIPHDRIDDEAYDVELEALQGRLARLTRRRKFRKRALVLAFEGMDAAGKGGAIRRATHALDARQYRVAPVSAPSAEEARYPYLWRFWRCVPEHGAITIYDRSWYGRVLVERVRGFADEAAWRRAYDEIREFERQLVEHGIMVAKFWMNVTKAEQLARFRARNEDPLKRFKVDKEDWINRRFYDAYQTAAVEMIERTHTSAARWTVVPADHKKTARVMVLRTVCETIERAFA